MSVFRKGNGPACPECGSVLSTRIANGWSEPDDHYLRYKRCAHCETKYCTVEVTLDPSLSSFYRLDYYGRELRRERWRRDHAKTEIRQPTRRSDLLRVTMLVTPRDGLTCQRGHRIEGDNLYERQDGTRQCRTCRLEVMRAYHRTRMRASRSA